MFFRQVILELCRRHRGDDDLSHKGCGNFIVRLHNRFLAHFRMIGPTQGECQIRNQK